MIDNLMLLTTDFEKEDEENFYCEPSELISILSLVFYKFQTRYDDEMNPL